MLIAESTLTLPTAPWSCVEAPSPSGTGCHVVPPRRGDSRRCDVTASGGEGALADGLVIVARGGGRRGGGGRGEEAARRGASRRPRMPLAVGHPLTFGCKLAAGCAPSTSVRLAAPRLPARYRVFCPAAQSAYAQSTTPDHPTHPHPRTHCNCTAQLSGKRGDPPTIQATATATTIDAWIILTLQLAFVPTPSPPRLAHHIQRAPSPSSQPSNNPAPCDIPSLSTFHLPTKLLLHTSPNA